MDKFGKEYHLENHHRIRNKYVQALGGKCVKCEATEELQFDHINPAEKEYHIGKILHCKENFVLRELSKCQLLCKTCHLEKTVSERTSVPVTHGSMYVWMKKKCQCETCTTAKQKYYIVRNERRRKKTADRLGLGVNSVRGPYSKDPPHGTSAKYKKGCKCILCKEANTEKARLQRLARKVA